MRLLEEKKKRSTFKKGRKQLKTNRKLGEDMKEAGPSKNAPKDWKSKILIGLLQLLLAGQTFHSEPPSAQQHPLTFPSHPGLVASSAGLRHHEYQNRHLAHPSRSGVGRRVERLFNNDDGDSAAKANPADPTASLYYTTTATTTIYTIRELLISMFYPFFSPNHSDV